MGLFLSNIKIEGNCQCGMSRIHAALVVDQVIYSRKDISSKIGLKSI